MFHTLQSSAPPRSRWTGGALFSTALHAGLVATIVLSTSKAGPVVRDTQRLIAEHVDFVRTLPSLVRPAVHEGTAGKSTTRRAPAQRHVMKVPNAAAIAQAIAQAIAIPDATAVPDLSSLAKAWLAQPDSLSTPPAGGLAKSAIGLAAAPLPVDGIYTEAMVDRSVIPRDDNPLPRYPESLRSMGVEGAFVVQFVVDTTGAVVADKIQFPSSMHRLFAEAVRTALLHSRYLPAQIAGRMVRQMVVQEFRFTLIRR